MENRAEAVGGIEMKFLILLFIVLVTITGTASAADIVAGHGGVTLQQSGQSMYIKRCTTTLLYCGDGTNNCNTVTYANNTNVTFLTNISDWSEIENLSISTAPYDRVYLNSSDTKPSEFLLPPEVREEATDKILQAFTLIILSSLLLIIVVIIVGLRELYQKYAEWRQKRERS